MGWTKKKWINVISLLLIPLYLTWAGQNKQWINVISLLLIQYTVFVVQPMHGKEESTAGI
jgi:hypothetical protein